MTPRDPATAPLKGTALVEASAGTGKTYTITTLFVRLVVERKLPVDKILVATFTEAATAELRDRVRVRLREELAKATDAGKRSLLARALRDFDTAAISTIHAFCLRVLQENAFETGAAFGLDLLSDQRLMMEEVGRDYWADRTYGMDLDLFRSVRKGFPLEKALTLTALFTRRFDLPTLPAVAPPDPALRLAEYQATVRRVGAQWKKSRARVKKLLDTSDGISRSKENYKKELLDEYYATLDDFFASTTPLLDYPGELKKFTASELTAKKLVKGTVPTDPFFNECESLVALADDIRASAVLRLKVEAAGYARTQLPERKAARGVQSFDDLLQSLDAALQGPRGKELAAILRGRFGAALIDEFQDTDPVQYRIFQSIFHHAESTLLLVGDPKQSIYGFRGADIFAYFDAKEAAGDHEYTLSTNYRSDPSLVKAVNTIFESPKRPFVFSEIGFRGVQADAPKDRVVFGKTRRAALDILFLPCAPGEKVINKGTLDNELPPLIAQDIARLLAEKPRIVDKDDVLVQAGDIAVLTRTNDQARWVQDELRKLRIPTALESEASVFESAEALELQYLLSAMLEPTRARPLKTALATSLVGLNGHDILAAGDDEQVWDGWSQKFNAWGELWLKDGFVQAFRRMLTVLNAEKNLLGLVDGERRLTNLLHLGELLHGASQREHLGMSGLVRWLSAMRADPGERSQLGSEASELRLESDARAIKLLTIHKSKGLEFPIVYCPFLYGNVHKVAKGAHVVVHDASRQAVIDLDPSDDQKEAAIREERAENQRLLYVALTRAKHHCVVVWGRINESEDSSLAYTLHGEMDKKATEAELRADLDKLVKKSGGTLGVRSPATGRAPPYLKAQAKIPELTALTFERRVDTWWRLGSFSSLTSGRANVSAPEEEGRDRDEADEVAAAPPAVAPEPVILHVFPRGASAGTMLHAIFEHVDFQEPDDLATVVPHTLARHGFPVDEWKETLTTAFDQILTTPLTDAGFTLRSIPKTKRLDELEFVVPVAPGSSVSAAAVADVLAKNPALPKSYEAAIRRLKFIPMRGFLRGFLDLLFEHDGRFWVVDYKSNHLGPSPDDYRASCLSEAMSHAHYFLQYHLYVVATHRHLTRTLRGYDYDKHFGGALYLFLRGMSPKHGAARGIFRDRPPREVIEGLATLLEKGGKGS